jgi:hypothetical protein
MCTPTVTENTIALEPVTRDDFAQAPAPAAARPRPAHRFIPEESRER